MASQQNPILAMDLTFPVKLFLILEFIDLKAPHLKSIMKWQDHGRCFHIIDKSAFEKSIMPIFFKSVHYDSIRRQLNIWGFQRVNSKLSPDFGGYYHEKFLRGQEMLSHLIERKNPQTVRAFVTEEVMVPAFDSLPPMPQTTLITNPMFASIAMNLLMENSSSQNIESDTSNLKSPVLSGSSKPMEGGIKFIPARSILNSEDRISTIKRPRTLHKSSRMSKHSSPLDLLDDGFESQLICSLYLNICQQDEELEKMETAVNYSNFLITGNYLRADYTPPTITEAKVAAKLHGCLHVLQTTGAISNEEQSLLEEKTEASTVCEDSTSTSNAYKTKQQDTSSICAKDNAHDNSNCSVNSVYTEEDEETIASFWRKHRKEKTTTPEIHQSLPLHRPQLVTPEMQLSPKPPKLSLQDGNQDHIKPKGPYSQLTSESFNWNKILNPLLKELSNNNLKSILPSKRKTQDLNPLLKEPFNGNFKYLPKSSNNNSSNVPPQKRKMIHDLNETIHEMNANHQTQTNSTKLSFEEAIERLLQFKNKFGHTCIPKSQPYLNLYEFCTEYRAWYQRHVRGQGLPMSEYSINALNAIGFDWTTPQQGHESVVSDTTKKEAIEDVAMNSFDEIISELTKFKNQVGHTYPPEDSLPHLHIFCKEYRVWYQDNLKGVGIQMPQSNIDALNAIGFEWNIQESNSGTTN
ncbi:hypothetical protein CTEN210_12293 [Chaetoceros tenuissimus]|uniref:HSF-type DNA-binding domain-containing protein n=1 Tax=Chaetoceros tenuissimus TaxID=426638 RepID=A0AAD3H9Q2_9STRA|nr:hypothetical protein CTEN210_12293 [Chaetoceros tenuissimus]